ncbi:MAG: hypothetical protein Q9215_004404 [Flavoplaca cf. flavocitrina]
MDRRKRSTSAVPGLGENAVRDLAASFVASGLEYWTEAQYEEYDEEYAGEGDEEYYEGYEEDQEEVNGASREGKEDFVGIPADRATTPIQDTAVPQSPA